MSDMTVAAPIALDRAGEITCVYCGVLGAVRFEWRQELIARPITSYSLAGTMLKASAHAVQWPWAVCRRDLGGCGHESKGKRA